MAATEAELESPDLASPVSARSASPNALSAMPSHWRRPSSKPKNRSAMTAQYETPGEHGLDERERGERER